MARPTIVERTRIMLRRAEACKLYVAGYSLLEIAEQLGYSSEKTAQKDIARALESYVEYQKQPIEELRARELAALDRAGKVVDEVMGREHLAHSNGRLVTIEDEATGEVRHVTDDGPRLQAVDRAVKISESRRKLLGQDAPSKVEAQVGGSVEYIVKISEEEMEAL
jgi:hypothetical protein